MDYRCIDCGVEFSTAEAINEHIDSQHNADYGSAGQHGGAEMRAIDRHEDAICDVLRWCDGGGARDQGVQLVAAAYELSPERLDHLVTVWQAIAGIQ